MKYSIGALFTMLAMAACGTGVESDPILSGQTDAGSGGNPDEFHGSSSTCPEIDGPRHDYATLTEANQLITGSWIHCKGFTPIPFADGVGAEFAPDGKYYVLVSDGHGQLVRGTGFPSQGTWDMKQDPGEPIFLEIWMTPSSLILNTPLFEDGPRRFALPGAFGSDLAIYQVVAP